MVECPPIGPDGHPVQIVGLDSAIIQNPQTWVASGHVGGFNDPMVDCRECKSRFRADHVAIVSFNKGDELLVALGVETTSEETAVADALAAMNSKNRRRVEQAGRIGIRMVFYE